jgi:hypothetical protein
MPPSTCASYPIRCFDRRARTTIRAPRPSPAATKTMIATKTNDHDGEIGRIDERMLHPDATYKERYGDEYFDGAVKYLYPVRPQSGLWRLSVLVFMAFGILDVLFVVSRCYDCGVRKY